MQEQRRRLYIHGREQDGTGGERFLTCSPRDGQPLCEIDRASAADVDAAVESAAQGFRVWSAMSGTERGRILRHAADLLRENRDRLARLEVLDVGKPISEAMAVDVDSGADCLEFYAGLAPVVNGEYLPLSGTAFAYTRREPLGVCVGIGAWNYPLQIACWKSAPALACGNAMVFKPSELTPLTALELAKIFTAAGLPPGVFNVVQGDARVGRALVQHESVAKVSLTGEVGTGKKVMADAAGTLKQVTMELGGKSPLIVFDDADIENAVRATLLANFYTQGEVCSNGTRVFVQRRLHNHFLDRLLTRTAKLVTGDPLESGTHIGALISAEHLEKVSGYVRLGKEGGAKLLCGGEAVKVPGLEGGWYLTPAIFDDCADEMRVVQEEIFGPVMALLTFDDEAEVIERANATPFGLAAGVFTRDLARGHRVIAQVQAGTTWINSYNMTPIEMPFGGVRQSGIGRENGLEALRHYTQVKSVYVETGDVFDPYPA
ncbi:MAG TPA: betaine-aldehyde dehydrogenase [Geminicoccus sp.]|jgi:betaine-aldehyde dehydrogenase|uniref:betaine-aldehyde dehydrogenase n=1 Tax=Geminicoccus sp. TaxID=2024832 RepID=UPI002E314DC9|nr:betaine-aldehyde dehydrogenase [Geminicoccus sp.]HEX2529047.1 betaine-aldehyde dehydrogenase [Geminicoccus sp.]